MERQEEELSNLIGQVEALEKIPSNLSNIILEHLRERIRNEEFMPLSEAQMGAVRTHCSSVIQKFSK